MKIKELQLKSEKELSVLLAEKKNQQGSFRFDFSKKTKDTSLLSKLRKDIARINTVLNSKNK